MEILMALTTGAIFSLGIYMVLRRSIVKLIIGFILLSHAANILIFTVSRLTKGQPPLIAEGSVSLAGDVADPLPQALILTAIVISFGLTAFAIILIKRAYQTTGSEDLDDMNKTDKLYS